MASRKQAAWEKFQKSLTPNQQKLVKEHILHEAIREAEIQTENRGFRVMPHYSLLNYVGVGQNSPQTEINAAVYWYHRKLHHLWRIVEGKAHMMSSSEL